MRAPVFLAIGLAVGITGAVLFQDSFMPDAGSPEEQLAESRPGRKSVPARAILEAVLWILNTGAQWAPAEAVLSQLQNGASPVSAVV